MTTDAGKIIDALGGTTELARLMEAPVSTVHSWRAIGIPASRMAHVRLLASTLGKPLPSDAPEQARAA